MKTTREMIEVMQAYVDGKAIQSADIWESQYIDNSCPRWDWPHVDYRIKPKPKVKRWLWAYKTIAGGWTTTHIFFTEEEAIKFYKNPIKIESSMIEVDE
jgi:hypothetical protein